MHGRKKTLFCALAPLSALVPYFVIFSLLFLNFVQAQPTEKDSLSHHIEIVDEITYSKENIDLLNKLAKKFRFRSPDSLMFFAQKLLALSHDNNDLNGIALGTMREGDYYSDLGNHKSALQKYFQAEEILKKIDRPKLKIDLHTQMAIEYFFVGQLRKTLESAYSGIDISQRNNLIWHEARLRHVLGFVYTQNRLYKEAEEELSKAIDLWGKTTDSLSLYSSRSNLARNAILYGDIEKSKKYFNGNIPFFHKLNETLWLARSYMVQSHIQLEENNIEQALESNKKYDSLLRKLKNPRDRILTYNLYTRLYFHTTEYNKARQYADSTIYHALQLKDSVELLNGYESLSKIANHNEAYEEAAKYSSLALPIKEALDKKSREDNLKLLRTKLELEYELLERELEDGKKLIRQRRITAVSLLLLAILIGLLLFGRRILKKRKARNNVLQKLNQTKNKLFSIIGHDLKAPIHTLQEVLSIYDGKDLSNKEIANMAATLKVNLDYSAFALNNLLYWAKTQMQGITSSAMTTNLRGKILEVLNVFDDEIKRKDLTIKHSGIEEISIGIDPIHLELILGNIISNAIKYSNLRGQIEIRANMEKETSKIVICDEGIGMNQKALQHLFKNEHFESRPGTMNEKGTGIGLALTMELIELYNGKIQFVSKDNKGTCVEVNFPIS